MSEKDERAMLEVMEERDIAQATAEKLADIISRITGVELGDYTAGLGCPGNDPLLNAIDAGERYIRAALEPLTREPDTDEVERVFAKLNDRIAYEFCCFGPLKPYEIGANDGPNWKRYLPKAEAVTKSARAAIAALPRSDASLREALEPFSKMAGELFARNFNKSDVVLHLTSSEHGDFILRFHDFLRARAALTEEPGHGA